MPKQTTLDEVVAKLESSITYAESYYERWEKNWKAYNSIRTHHDYFGVANDFVPETFTIIESIKANIMGGKQRFEYMPQREDQNADTKVLNNLVEHYWYSNNFPAATTNSTDDMLKNGTGFLWNFWDGDKGVIPKYVPLKDNIVDPLSTNYWNERYQGFRYLTTIDQLKAKTIVDPETGEIVPRFKNLNKVKPLEEEGGSKDQKTDKQTKDDFNDSTLDEEARKEQVEVFYYVDKEKLVQIANRNTIIEERETPFKRDAEIIDSFDDQGNPVQFELPEIKPFLPRAPFRDYIDGSLFYAKGEIDIIRETQERLNDTSSQKRDNLSYMVNRSYVLDPAFADKIDEFDSVPGAIYTVPPGAIDTLPVQPIGADADNEMFRIKDEMRRATAADEIIQGAGQDKGLLTATEVRAQLAQAGSRFSLKINQLEREAFKITADIIFKLIQINVDTELAVRIIGPNGAEFKNYNPGEYLGDYEPRVMLETSAAAVAEEEKQNAMMFYQMASQQPFINPIELFKQTATKMFQVDQQDLDNLILEPQQPQIPLEEVAAQEGVTEQDLAEAEAELVSEQQVAQDEAVLNA